VHATAIPLLPDPGALKLDRGAYAGLKKEFTIHVSEQFDLAGFVRGNFEPCFARGGEWTGVQVSGVCTDVVLWRVLL
jgi:hypothetical protein